MDTKLLTMLDRELGEPLQVRPKDFGITAREYMQEKNCSETIARDMLEKGVKLGILEKKQMITGTGTAPFVYFEKKT